MYKIECVHNKTNEKFVFEIPALLKQLKKNPKLFNNYTFKTVEDSLIEFKVRAWIHGIGDDRSVIMRIPANTMEEASKIVVKELESLGSEITSDFKFI